MIASFFLAFAFSFLGSIPPGTLNLTVIQLGLENKIRVAWKFAFASTLMEYPYAWLAFKFESLIVSSPLIINNLQLLTGVVMVVLGVLNYWSASKPTSFSTKFENSGFRRGLVLGTLNPLAIPYWVGIIAYLRAQDWIDISSTYKLHSFLVGVVLGAFLLLIIFTYLAKRVVTIFRHSEHLKKIPGIVLILLGIYALTEYFV